MSDKKEQRTEYISMYVTESTAKEFKVAQSNETLQEDIVRKFITNETDWLKSEMKDIDDTAIQYKAKLITIKDTFSEAQDAYIEEIESIYSKSSGVVSKINSLNKTLAATVTPVLSAVTEMNRWVNSINLQPMERLLSLMEKFNKFSDKDKEIIKTLMQDGKNEIT